MEHINNQILLRGQLVNLPEISHENHGKTFYRFSLDVPRLSGAVDRLNIIAEALLLNQLDLSAGTMITVSGQIRSHNLRQDGSRHLMIFVFATQMAAEDGEPCNEVILDGLMCKEPIYRCTPLGREICDVMLAVPRSFRRADYLPCILWGRTAKEASTLHVRQQIRIYGRLQSRLYTKITPEGSIQKVAYEISALSAEFPDDTI